MKTQFHWCQGAALALTLVVGLSLAGCGGGGGSAAATPTPTPPPTPTPQPKTKVVLQGRIVDDPIPNAVIVASSGTTTFNTVADAQGNYSLPVELLTSEAATPVVITATGVGAQANVKLVSLAGSLATLATDAGADGVLTAAENIRSNVTHVSTAEAALVMQITAGATPTTQAQLDGLRKQVDPVELLEVAAAIKLIVDSPQYDLPSGVSDTLAFAQNAQVRDSYVAEVKAKAPQDLEGAKRDTANSADVAMGLKASDIPATLLTAVIDNDARVSVNEVITVLDYTFDPSGTGTIFDGAGRSTMKWRISGNQIVVDIDNPVVNDDRSSGELVRSTYRQAVLSFLTKTLLSTTFNVEDSYPETSGKPSTSRTETNSSQIILPETDFAPFLPANFASNGGKFLSSTYLPANGRNNRFAGDVLTFSPGGKGSAQYLAQSFDWSVSSAGALTLRYASGATLTLNGLNIQYSNQDANTTYVYAEINDGGTRYADIIKVIKPSSPLVFDTGSLPSQYYLYGLGNFEGGKGHYDGRLKGFRIELFTDGTGFQGEDYIDGNGAVQDDNFQRTPSGFLRWALGSDGVLSVRRYFDSTLSTAQARRSCDPASDANCQAWDIRDIMPFGRANDRLYWLERRRINYDGAVNADTPSAWTVRYWDRTTGNSSIVGSWQVVDATGTRDIAMTFFGDGRYVLGGAENDPSCKSDNNGANDSSIEDDGNGWERGNYQWSAAGGAFSVSNVTQTDGSCGLSGGQESVNQLVFNKDGLLLPFCPSAQDRTKNACADVTLKRIPSVAGSLTGAWTGSPSGSASDPIGMVYFFASNRFLYIEADNTPDNSESVACQNGGIEVGSFSFDPGTGAFSVSNLTTQTDGTDCGLNQVDAEHPAKLTFKGDSQFLLDGMEDGNDAFRVYKVTTP